MVFICSNIGIFLESVHYTREHQTEDSPCVFLSINSLFRQVDKFSPVLPHSPRGDRLSAFHFLTWLVPSRPPVHESSSSYNWAKTLLQSADWARRSRLVWPHIQIRLSKAKAHTGTMIVEMYPKASNRRQLMCLLLNQLSTPIYKYIWPLLMINARTSGARHISNKTGHMPGELRCWKMESRDIVILKCGLRTKDPMVR